MKQINRLRRYPLLLMFWTCVCSVNLAAEDIHIGILDWRTLEDFDQHWAPALQGVERNMPAYQLILHPMTLAQLDAAVAEDALDFVITNPGHYVALSHDYAVAPLAQLQHLKSGLPLNHVGSVMLTRQDRHDLKTLSDLQGKRVGAVSPDSFGGYQLMLNVMHQQNIDLTHWNIDWEFTDFPMDQLVEGILKDQFDAIILRSCLAEVLALEDKVDLDQLRLVGDQSIPGYPCMISSSVYPGWPLLRTSKVNDTLARQVLAALMNSQAVRVGQDVIHWQPPVSYQQVYQVFEQLRIGPFSAFPHHPVLHWLEENRFGLTILSALLGLLIIHHIRTEYLVRRRTRELQLSQKKQRETEVVSLQHQEELRHASRFALMGELTAGLAHELNQPLTAIANYARGSARHLQRSDEEVLKRRSQLVEVSEQIAQQADQAAGVIRNIRLFLRKETEDFSWISVEKLIEDAVLFCHARLSDACVTPNIQISDHLPALYTHPVHLLQILANLMTNALDAMMDCDRDQRELIIRVKFDLDSQSMVIRVLDRGRGISAEIEARLFEPFMTTRKDGMGLGLSLSRSLAEALGGQLNLRNREGGGVMAELILPLRCQLSGK